MKQLLWHEPAKYLRAKYNQLEALDPLRSVKFALFCFFVVLGARWLGGVRPAPDMHPPSWTATVGGGLMFAIFVAYLLPRFIGLFANSIVILSPKGVNNNTVAYGVRFRFWPWSVIAYCYAWTESLNDDQYSVLSFCDDRGMILTTLACSEKVSMSEVGQALHAYGIPLQFEQPTA